MSDSVKRKEHSKRSGLRHHGKPSDDWTLADFHVPEAEGKTRFHDLDLELPIMRAVSDLGFSYCSPIQGEVLPYTLDGYDAIGKAQTGTGKTAAFLITAINDLLLNPITEPRYVGEPRALIIAPTRELVLQIADDAQKLCKYTDLNVVALIGGTDFDKQQKQLDRAVVDIVAATPGRLMDFYRRGFIHLDTVEILVLDEADRMLDMGFIPQVKQIVNATPNKTHRQTLLFSATFNYDVTNLAHRWTNEPVTIEIEPESVATDTVTQKMVSLSETEKLSALKTILKQSDVSSAIIFANRRDTTRFIYEQLRSAKFKVGMLSGEVAQQKRSKTLADFKQGTISVLVATDVAGRGIHVDGISHVINYDMPEDPDDYVHRIGRTGRAGEKGVAYTFVGEMDAFGLADLEQLLGKALKVEPPPKEWLPD